MELQARRASDALRAVDGVVDSYMRHSDLGSRRIANLAATIAIENSGARSGSLLLNDGDGLHPAIAIRADLTPALSPFEHGDRASVQRAEDTAEMVVLPGMLAAPIVCDGEVKGMLCLNEFTEAPSRSVQELAGNVASRIASLLKNAELLEALDRTNQDLQALARMGEQFALGSLDDDHLAEAVEHAVRGTGSAGGVLGLFSSDGDLDDCFCVGIERDEVLASFPPDIPPPQALDALGRAFPGSVLLETLSSDALRRGASDKAYGFLAIFRPLAAPFKLSERSFLRAISNLLSGALARREYFRRASEDELTATGTRFALQLALAEAQTRSLETGLPFSVLMVDIDRFKEINDDYGHMVGDAVLKEVAQVLRARLRGLDSVSRYGGDEFVVVLPDSSAQAATQVAEALCELVEAKRFEALADSVSLSLGVAEFVPGENPAETLRRADLALYSSKREGRARVTCYHGAME